MTRAAIAALLSHWRQNRLMAATMLAGLALATALWSAVQAINGEARANYADAAQQLGRAGLASLSADSRPLTLADYVHLRRAGWQVSPVLEGRIAPGGTAFRLLGVDPLSYPAFPQPDDITPELGPAELFTGPGALFLRPDLARALADVPGLPRLIETQAAPPGVAIADIALAERLLQSPGALSRILVLPDQPQGLAPLATLAPDLTLSQPDESADTARLTDSFHLNLTAFALLSFAVGLFIVHGTAGLAFQQRRALFRTLRALGLSLRGLAALVLGELALLALIAGLAGLALGYGIAAALLPDVAATLRGLYGAPASGSLTLRPGWIASGLGMAFGGALLAGAQGLWQLWRMPLLDAPGSASWSAAHKRRMPLMLGGAAGLAGASLLIFTATGGLLAGFVLLGGLLLGAALALPPLLHAVLGLIARRAGGPVAEWVWADMRAQLPGLSLALMALLLALATNIGVGTMVASFRLTFTGWLDQRLASELYVTARSDAEGAALESWLATRADAVLPIRRTDIDLAGAPGRLFGVADHATYRDNWPLIAQDSDAWDRLATGDGVIVNEQLARREGLWPGAEIPLKPGLTVPVVGVYSDYGNPSGQAIVSLDLLGHAFPGTPNRQFGIRIAPDKAAALAADLRAAFDLPESAITDQAAIKALSLGIFEKTFVVTGALNALTLGVACFAILTALLTLWTIRLPQLAPVWALGLPRARLARLEIARSVGLAGLTALAALPLGLLLAWVLLAVINVEAFGWRLPLHLFPLDWLRLMGLALLAGAIAALLPARRLHRLPPSELSKVFAHAR